MTQQPPPGPPPGPAPYGAPYPSPVFAPPVYQPGVVPLRPLTLGDVFGGAFATVRRNPTATLGTAFLVSFAFMLLPMLLTVLLAAAHVFPSMVSAGSSSDPGDSIAGSAFLFAGTLVNAVFAGLSSLVVTGLLVRVVDQAVVGRRSTTAEAWRFSRGRLLPLLGLTLLSSLITVLVLGIPVGVGVLPGVATHSLVIGILGGLAGLGLALAALLFVYVRYLLLSPAILVLEGAGVVASMRRAGALVLGQFWRIFGIYLLAALAVGAVGQVVAVPLALLGGLAPVLLPSSWAAAGTLLASSVSSVLTSTITAPFTSAVLVLLYVDQRFRKEGYDIELLDQTVGPRPGAGR